MGLRLWQTGWGRTARAAIVPRPAGGGRQLRAPERTVVARLSQLLALPAHRGAPAPGGGRAPLRRTHAQRHLPAATAAAAARPPAPSARASVPRAAPDANWGMRDAACDVTARD